MKLKIYLLSFFVLFMAAAYFVGTEAEIADISSDFSNFSNNALLIKANSFVENPVTIPVYWIIVPIAIIIVLIILFVKKDKKEASAQSGEIDKLLKESLLLNEKSQDFSKMLKETIGELIIDEDTGIYKDQKNELNKMIYEFMDTLDLFNKEREKKVMKIITELGIAKKMNEEDSKDTLAQIEKSKNMIEEFLNNINSQEKPKNTKTSKKKAKKK